MRNLAADAALNVPPGKNDVPYATKLELVRSILGSMCEGAAGKYTGTGASLDIATPFDPAVVFIWDVTQACLGIKFPTLADDDTLLIDTLAVQDTAGGITLGTLKFNVGTEAKLNTTSDVCHWFALAFRGNTGTT